MTGSPRPGTFDPQVSVLGARTMGPVCPALGQPPLQASQGVAVSLPLCLARWPPGRDACLPGSSLPAPDALLPSSIKALNLGSHNTCQEVFLGPPRHPDCRGQAWDPGQEWSLSVGQLGASPSSGVGPPAALHHRRETPRGVSPGTVLGCLLGSLAPCRILVGG